MKKIFLKRQKEPTAEENRQALQEAGIATGTKSSYREPKFSQFSQYAQNVATKATPSFGPNQGASQGGVATNPYAQASSSQLNYQGSLPTGSTSSPYGDSGAYKNNLNSTSAVTGRSPSPYSGPGSGSSGVDRAPSPYAAAESSYANRFSANGHPLTRVETDESYIVKREELFKGAKIGAAGAVTGAAATGVVGGLPGRSTMNGSAPLKKTYSNEQDELFELPSEVDKKYRGTAGTAGQDQTLTEVDSEEEDVEAIKQQLRFTKQASVASTRNTLRIAAEAEESGRNTLGMLGSQGERLANTERNLAIAATQNKIAEEKARELKTLNRSMFAIHVANPFNSKRRNEEREQQIRSTYEQEQYQRELRRQTAYDSQQRVMGALDDSKGPSEVALKYKKQTSAQAQQKYQFEADSEDEEMENEIDSNLDGISTAASRLRKLALTTNEEIIRQNERLDRIADDTDKLDVNVHLNTSRLANIR